MQAQYVLILLACAAFADFAKAVRRDATTIRFEKLQYHIDKISTDTHATFDKIENDLYIRDTTAKKNMMSKYENAKKKFSAKQSQEVAQAIKGEKDTVAANIEFCVKHEQPKYLIKLAAKSDDSTVCIAKATQTAWVTARRASRTFDLNSFTGSMRSDIYEAIWRKCLIAKNELCIEKTATMYTNNIATTQNVANITLAEGTVAYKTQIADLDNCLKNADKEIENLQEEHAAKVVQCQQRYKA